MPVNKIFPAINLILLLCIVALATMSIRIWTHPTHPLRVDGSSVIASPKTIKKLAVSRPNYNSEAISQVIRTNIFRKERKEYIPPISPNKLTTTVVSKPILPPPEMLLTGILMLGGTKIAILQGSYWLNKTNKLVKQKIKKKGYTAGQMVGNFQLTEIDKTSVTLDDQKGQVVQLQLIKRGSKKAIQRTGTAFFHKNKIDVITKAPSVVSASRISGTRTLAAPVSTTDTAHISGK